VRLTLNPVVRVDPHERVLHRQLWRRRYWRPVGFTHGKAPLRAASNCADVGPRVMSDECPTRRGYRNGPRARRNETPRAPRPDGSRGSEDQDVSEDPGEVRRRGSVSKTEP